MDPKSLLAFLRGHRLAVLSSVSAMDRPQAAVIGFAITDRFEIIFDTLASKRKAKNLRQNPRLALVIGGLIAGDERTVQYVASGPSSDSRMQNGAATTSRWSRAATPAAICPKAIRATQEHGWGLASATWHAFRRIQGQKSHHSRAGHFTVTVKQPVRNSFVGLVKLSTNRNITSNRVPSEIVGAAKSICTAPAPPFDVCNVTSGPAAGSGNVTKFGAGAPQGGSPAAR